MAISYEKKPRPGQGYSFQGGKLKLQRQEPLKKSILETSEIIPRDKQEKSQKAFDKETQKQEGPQNKATMDDDGNINMNGAHEEPNVTTQFDTWLRDEGINQSDYSTDEGIAQWLNERGVKNPTKKQIDDVRNQKLKYNNAGEFTRGEASSGGDLSPELINTAKELFPSIKDLGLKVTGGNDAFHQSDQYFLDRAKSKRYLKHRPKGIQDGTWSREKVVKWARENLRPSDHADGNSMDFTVKDPEQARKKFVALGAKKEGNTWVMPDGTRIDDEYANPAGHASGPHFHMTRKGGKKHKH